MPMYTYECPHCGHEFQWIRTIAQREIADCPKCEGFANRAAEIELEQGFEVNPHKVGGILPSGEKIVYDDSKY